MPRLNDIPPDDWRSRIACSNATAMAKRFKYPPHEAEFLRTCCVFAPPNCGPDCFCRRMGCSGVWLLRPDLEFEAFKARFANLWSRGALRGPRVRNAVSLLDALQQRWSAWDERGRRLPQVVNDIRRCYFCDDAFDVIRPIRAEIFNLADDSTRVFTSKLVSQLFYDIAVPFDTNSGKRQKSSGYDPLELGGDAMWRDARVWLQDRRMSIDEFRRLDDAPSTYWPLKWMPDPPNLTACSRVFDKLFYK